MTPKPWRGIGEVWWLCAVAASTIRTVYGFATGDIDWIPVAITAIAVLTVAVAVAVGCYEARQDEPVEQRNQPPPGYRLRRLGGDLTAAGNYLGTTWHNIGGW